MNNFINKTLGATKYALLIVYEYIVQYLRWANEGGDIFEK